jgi:hypothetical protein
VRLMATLADHYLQEMAVSIRKVEVSEQDYKSVIDEYQAVHGETVTADYKAASDQRLQQAIGDGAFYRSRATMYATAAVAVQMDEQRQRGAL